MLKFEDAYNCMQVLSGRLTLWTLHEISRGNNTRLGLESEWRQAIGGRDLMKIIAILMENDFIHPIPDVNGLTRFHINGERFANLASFISGLGAKPVETRSTTCTVETVAIEVKALEDMG